MPISIRRYGLNSAWDSEKFPPQKPALFDAIQPQAVRRTRAFF
jgi:hypothetical protein